MTRILIPLASLVLQIAATPGLAQTAVPDAAARTMAQNARIEMPAPPAAPETASQPPRSLRAVNPQAPSRR